MVAIEAMWEAANKYQPDRGAKFTTYVAYEIQHKLASHSTTEVGGWDAAEHILTKYMNQLKNAKLYGAPLPDNYHRVEGRGDHMGLSHEQMLAGRYSSPIESVELVATEEADAFDEPSPLQLAEIAMAENEDVESTVIYKSQQVTLKKVLGTLSEREAGVISMRFGLDDGKPKTLDEIGRMYGVTRERVRQIESQTMSKLRNPSRSGPLRGYLSTAELPPPHTTLHPYADGTGHVKTKPHIVPDRSQEPGKKIPATYREPNLESWQAYPDEKWDDF